MEVPDTKNSLAALIHRHLKDTGRHLRSHPSFKESEDTEDVFRHLLERLAEVETDQEEAV